MNNIESKPVLRYLHQNKYIYEKNKNCRICSQKNKKVFDLGTQHYSGKFPKKKFKNYKNPLLYLCVKIVNLFNFHIILTTHIYIIKNMDMSPGINSTMKNHLSG